MGVDTQQIEENDRKEVEGMYEVYPSDWPVAVDSTDPRNRFHETALHEARVATDRREATEPVRPARTLVARFRLALAGGHATPTQACVDCPA